MKTRGQHILNNRGMTLIEIMIVLGILAGMGALILTQVNSSLKKANYKKARIIITELGKALDTYYADCGKYPSSLEALLKNADECSSWGPDPYVKKKSPPLDPWDNDFFYESEGSSYELISLGEDGEEGGKDFAKDLSSNDDL